MGNASVFKTSKKMTINSDIGPFLNYCLYLNICSEPHDILLRKALFQGWSSSYLLYYKCQWDL